MLAENDDLSISVELKNLLSYIATGHPKDQLTKQLEKHVDFGRMKKEWRREYMTMQEYADMERSEGRAEGRSEGINVINKLGSALIQDNRLEDLRRSFVDPEFQRELLREYGLEND